MSRNDLIGEGAMEQQQPFSSGLLYSVAPENLSGLHLDGGIKHDEFDWETHEADRRGVSFTQSLLSFLGFAAGKRDLSKPEL
jgi:hypothetical protein